MKIKKYILSLLIGATALSFSACNDFLDRDPHWDSSRKY